MNVALINVGAGGKARYCQFLSLFPRLDFRRRELIPGRRSAPIDGQVVWNGLTVVENDGERLVGGSLQFLLVDSQCRSDES